MTIGQKIKKFRTEQKLSQKQLAIRVGISEPAIRNYELGNRVPSKRQIKRIAKSLNISPYALLNAELDTDDGLMHALFYLEDKYGLQVLEQENIVYFHFGNNSPNSIKHRLHQWSKEVIKLENDIITKGEYDNWRHRYPIQVNTTKKMIHEQGGSNMKSIGRRIKRIRQMRGLTQMQAAIDAGFNGKNVDVRIAQYESGKRTPHKATEALAKAFSVEPYAIKVPNVDSYFGVLHTLFSLEDEYGMRIVDVNGEPHLKFSNESSDRLLGDLSEWLCEYKKLLNNKISKQQYDEWRYTYPQETK